MPDFDFTATWFRLPRASYFRIFYKNKPILRLILSQTGEEPQKGMKTGQ